MMKTTTTRTTVRALALLTLLGMGLGTGAGCLTDATPLTDRLCNSDSECPGNRVCSDGVCIISEAEPQTICRGNVLVTLRISCADFDCQETRVETFSEQDCTKPKEPECSGDALVEFRPGVCDPEAGVCQYPERRRTDCTAEVTQCEEDALITFTNGTCDERVHRCSYTRSALDCRELEPRCDEGSPNIAIIPRYLEDVPACDPVARACDTRQYRFTDCAQPEASCDGDLLVERPAGTCLSGVCTPTNDAEVTRTDCTRIPEAQCNANVLTVFTSGGACDDRQGRCVYEDSEATDCDAPVVICEGDDSVVLSEGTCRANDEVCDYAEETRTDCTELPPSFCQEGNPRNLIEFTQGGTCLEVTGLCVYPSPTVRDCAQDRFECENDTSVARTDGTCEDGVCNYTETRTECAEIPEPSCDGLLATNHTQPGACGPTGQCSYSQGTSQTLCIDRPFCQGNVLFRPSNPVCLVDDDEAFCQYRNGPQDDCNTQPGPRCEGNTLITFAGGGVCDAVAGGCNFDAVREETLCASCISGEGRCVLPGFVQVGGDSVFAMGMDTERVEVELPGSVVMSATELTRGQLNDLINAGYLEPDELPEAHMGCDVDTCPVVGISWLNAVRYANALSQSQGLLPCYDRRGLVVGGHRGNPYLCEGYRLPTEAEWELAYRAGTETRFYCGDNCAEEIGWFADNAQGRPQPVGGLAANGLRLRDMAGNAREWTHDVYSTVLTGGYEPYGRTFGRRRVLRGGSWLDSGDALTAFARTEADLSDAPEDAGVRLVRSLTPRLPDVCVDDGLGTGGHQRLTQAARSACELLPGVPCSDEAVLEECPRGCRRGQCLRTDNITLLALGEGHQDLTQPLVMTPINARVGSVGDTANDDASETVVLSHDVWLSTTEITQEQFYALLPDFVYRMGG